MTVAHLGGYTVGGDPATFYPDLWRWLVERLNVRSVIDVGCGEGHALEHFRTLGCRVHGVDGVPQDNPNVFAHDYTQGVYVPWENGAPVRFDLCWCCEFVEHVEERYAPNFLATFKRANLVALTHAEPGQQGYHHVNCRTGDYWVGAMAAIGYQLDFPLTNQARAVASINQNPWNHFSRSGMVFTLQSHD